MDYPTTIRDAAEALSRKDVTARELTQRYLDKIKKEDKDIHAYLRVNEEMALAQADASDVRRANGESKGALDGIPLALKDNICVRDTITTAGSKILESFKAPYDATVASKLLSHGAVVLGKTNMDEFAMGSSTENSAFGPTKNPVDPTRVPGGSSGGSAAAVAADLCVAALGSDTGGSIRQPAAFCGIVGFKPSYGRLSRSGLIAMASSLDQIGPMTRTVEDAAILYAATVGRDVLDQTTVDVPETPFVRRDHLRGVRIGLPREAWGEGMSEEVRNSVVLARDLLTTLGAELVDIDLPYADAALAVYYVLMPCEVSANLSRFDGIRYGDRAKAASLLDTYMESRAQGLGTEVKRRVLLGAYALSKGYYDAYYRQARKVQTLIKRAYDKAFSQVDVLLTPTTPSVAFKLGEKINDPLSMYLEDVFTVGVNVAGLPAISVPCQPDGMLPVGVQLIGKRFEDVRLLETADVFERNRIKIVT